MKSFRYLKVNSTEVAANIVSDQKGKIKVFAGGTDLFGTLKDNIHFDYPEMLLDLKGLDELSFIEENENGISIGALTRLSQIQTDPHIHSRYRLLSEAAKAVGSPQIRNVATIGGNICQETRCWYYRYPENTFPCVRKGGKLCNAFTGENQFHSIFGPARVETTPCSSACPGGVAIAEYMERLRAGDYTGAAEILLSTNPLPSITGRVCPHYCEGDCNRGTYDHPVSIRGVERFLGDFILDNAKKLFRPPAVETGKAVAIVGSGPAGLSAAYYLRKMGHRVHVFDRNERAGGMLAYSIPNYRLPPELVNRVVESFVSAGVKFQLGVEVGRDIPLMGLEHKYDAVFLATGAWASASADFEGVELSISALEFLMGVKQGRRDLSGSKVVVIGGGNVAVDSAITARRLGAGEVTMVCLESREEMPALEREIKEAIEENVKLMTSWGPSRIISSEARVVSLELKRCASVFDENRKFCPQFDESTRRTLDADMIILAVGQRPELSYVSPELETVIGRIRVDSSTQATNIRGIFAGGDNTSGPATVIEALAAGRRAAASINCFLKDLDTKTDIENENRALRLLGFDPSCFEKSSRTNMPCRPIIERNPDSEDSLGFSSSEIESEAKRCFNCGCVAVNPSDVAPALIALDARIKTTKRTVKAESFFMAGRKGSTVLEEGELVTEIEIPRLRPGTRQGYRKFRIRQSIDFPIVSLASVFVMNGDEIEDARLVIGAAAPVPLRLVPVEDFLKGKKISEQMAGEAAEIAVRQATPLRKNDYKIKVTKALVRDAVFELL